MSALEEFGECPEVVDFGRGLPPELTQLRLEFFVCHSGRTPVRWGGDGRSNRVRVTDSHPSLSLQ